MRVVAVLQRIAVAIVLAVFSVIAELLQPHGKST